MPGRVTSYADTLQAAAHAAYEAGRHDEADATLRLLVGQADRTAHAVYFIGHLSYLRGRIDEAQFYLTASIGMDPNNARAHNDLGEVLRLRGRRQEAIAHLERAIALEPSLAHAYGNLAATLLELNRPSDALRWSQAALWYAADKAVAHCDLGSALGRLNRPREALRQFELACAARPGFTQARFFAAMIRLGLGEMPEAWTDYELRLSMPQPLDPRQKHPQPCWQGGSEVAGKTILLQAEQGFGDTIQFVRYAPMVAALGATVRLEVPGSLVPLLRGLPGVASVHSPGDPLPPFDLQCALMSLPHAFRTSMQTIPASVPYLSADCTRRAAWEKRLGPWTRMRIGVAWSGNASHPNDPARTIALASLATLFNRPDATFHVVQRDIRECDWPTLGATPNLHDHGAALADFADTAALISLMDLVISVDTAPAHLAGALGRPTWILLPRAADWRWMRDRGDSPWYPTMRLFRQAAQAPPYDDDVDGWKPVIDTIARQLDQWSQRQ